MGAALETGFTLDRELHVRKHGHGGLAETTRGQQDPAFGLDPQQGADD